MSLKTVVLIGAGGHARVVLEAIRAQGGFTVAGLIDPHPSAPTILGETVLGDDDALAGLRCQGIGFAVIGLGGNAIRQRIAVRLQALGFELPAIIHPSALVSPSGRIGDGVVVMARAVIGTQTRLHDWVIVNTGAIIDHDNEIGVAAHVAPGCALAGNVSVGARVLVGVGSAVRPGISIGADAVIGAGSAVVANVAAGTTVGGAPARKLRQDIVS